MKKMKKILHKGLTALFVVLGVITLALYINLYFMTNGFAEPLQEEVWVLCQPESCVNLRAKPQKGAEIFGGTMCGSGLWTDGKQKGTWLHVVDLPAEESQGWISSRYIVYDRPEEINREMVVRADGRVACRKWIGGDVSGWANDGDRVTVYWKSADWAVTSRGYIKTAFLEEE